MDYMYPHPGAMSFTASRLTSSLRKRIDQSLTDNVQADHPPLPEPILPGLLLSLMPITPTRLRHGDSSGSSMAIDAIEDETPRTDGASEERPPHPVNLTSQEISERYAPLVAPTDFGQVFLKHNVPQSIIKYPEGSTGEDWLKYSDRASELPDCSPSFENGQAVYQRFAEGTFIMRLTGKILCHGLIVHTCAVGFPCYSTRMQKTWLNEALCKAHAAAVSKAPVVNDTLNRECPVAILETKSHLGS